MRLLHRMRWGPALELWLDGELDPARVDSVLLHMENCPDCAEAIEAMAQLKAAISRVEVG